MRFSKSSVKLTLCAGRLPNKQSHVLFKKQAHPVKRIHFTDVKTTQTISYDFSAILVQKDFKHGLKLRSQPLQSKEIKISSTVLIHKIYQRAIKPPKDFIKFSSQVPLFNGHAALQGPSPDSKTQGFNLYIFLQQREFNVFGSKLAKSPQTGTQAKESKNAL